MPLVDQVTLGRRAYFSAGRELRRDDWNEEQNARVFGKDVQPHGHDYTVDIFYTGTPAEEDGMIVNLTEVKPILQEAIAPLEGAWLNALPQFREQLPTAENLVEFLWQRLPTKIASGTLSRVCLQETSCYSIEKTADSKTMRVTKEYEFAAAHRLHAPTLSDEENCRRYGKCNNLRGHGHNYRVRVTLEGQTDEHGVLLPAPLFDEIVEQEIFERFDHKHLNEDCPEFVGLIPTSENLARVIFDKVSTRIASLDRNGLRLAKIGLHETQKNYFEVSV
jgi:6-pyruvoyltetrahydropterin/6-carboxytetrahydropterin synthase